MKNKRKLIALCILMTAFLLYRSMPAFAREGMEEKTVSENGLEPAFVPEEGTTPQGETAPESESTPETAPESESTPETAPESESRPESVPEPEPEAETAPEPEAETASAPEPEEETVSGNEPETEIASGTMPETEIGSEAGTVSENGLEQVTVAEKETIPESAEVLDSLPAAEPDTVSTGGELTAWLESHKDTGGTVRLTNDVILEGTYLYVSTRFASAEPVLVDTAGYTVTVIGEAEFWGNSRLTFRGQSKQKGFLYVAEGGFLSLHNVALESEIAYLGEEAGCMLWQEEGSCLAVEDCHMSGDVHYADSPYILYKNTVCAVLEKGQRVQEALPKEIECTVNRQGNISYREPMAVRWNLEGTESSQEERRRFQVQGVYTDGTSKEAPVCTVAYNDYPLTFMEVSAGEGTGYYFFRGNYTKSEEYLPFTLHSEYSFDCENWIVYDERRVPDSNALNTFFIGINRSEWDTGTYPEIFLRLQCSYNGEQYFSNVLSYTPDNLEAAEDHGGSRGGGTSIVNLPDEPDKSFGNETSVQKLPSDVNPQENGQPPETQAQESGQPPEAQVQESKQPPEAQAQESKQPPEVEVQESKQTPEAKVQQSGQPAEEKPGGDSSASETTSDAAQSDNAVHNSETQPLPQGENTAYGSYNDCTAVSERSDVKNIAVISVFVTASGIAGATGFCIHAGLFRRWLYRAGKIFSK